MAKAITVIPATKDKFTALPTASIKKRKVAAYARVSTDSDEQFTSYEAQIDYYTQYIKKRDDWEFVKVYTDEGISGTNTKRREGFNEMVADALASPEAAEKILNSGLSVFDEYLVTAGIPDPDLIIRTSGETRLSNYLLWQAAYSEFLFVDTLWPDFRKPEFRLALKAYASRDRRYGKVK